MSDVSLGVLPAFGWSNRVLALFSDVLGSGVEPARVVRVERSACVVVVADGSERLVQASVLPAVGDWVAIVDSSVEAVLPRWSTLTRADPLGEPQVLAVNIDLVLIAAPADRLSVTRVERELAIAWDSGAQPVVVLTKADVSTEAYESLTDRLVGVDVLATSAATGLGVPALQELLQPAKTAVLLGPSGAGKSTLANALIGADVLATGAVREQDSRGRHTTTSRQLIALPGGGVLIDTPGLRSLGLSGDVDVSAAFPEIEELAAGCRFADCSHEVEPDCAVLAAVESGELGQARLDSYRKLDREAAVEARKTDWLARKAQQQVYKARTKEWRSNPKYGH